MTRPIRKTGKRRSAPPAQEGGPQAASDFCPVVGLGASAGGFEAFQQFFSQMPADSGMAFVIIQHLDPKHDTLMPELLARHTAMPVRKAEDGSPLEPNHILIVPPHVTFVLDGCRLRVASLQKRREKRPIDQFFRSLAREQRENVVGIVLSGAGSDGTLGLKAIKEHGGLAIAQSIDTARYDSMPRNAISSGLMDYVLPPNEMPGRIIEYIRRLQVEKHKKGVESAQKQILESLRRIVPILRRKTGHDFSRYKQSTLARRIQRRMQLMCLESPTQYVQRLQSDANEVSQLFKDLLIGVTQFFRDPDAFESLARLAIRPLLKEKRADSVVRVWVPGCATGEEAYTIAFLLFEEMARLERLPCAQIFATDLDDEALDYARRGRYPESIAEQFSQSRLERFFTRRDSYCEVAQEIREMCVFSPHNIIQDPPFSRLDLISCRNLLIYLESDLQKRLLPLFHYALNPSGFLFLGPSENLASRSELFRAVEKKHRIFQRRPASLRPPPHVGLIAPGRVARTPPAALAECPREQNIPRAIERVILEEFAPAGVVVNEQGDVLYFSGKTGKYLEHQAGAPTNKLLNMARKSLRLELRSLIHRVVSSRQEAVRENVAVRLGKATELVNLIARPLIELGKDSELFIVIFQEAPRAAKSSPKASALAQAALEQAAVRQIENELRAAREDLQTTIEELESSNEELKSANEELLSMNEELQSTNEELQTSKEELQSLNDELQRKVEELDVANSDLQNLFQSAQVATIFVDERLRVKKLTPMAARFLPIGDKDVGRHLFDAAPELATDEIASDIERALRMRSTRERSLELKNGSQWSLLRVSPYQNLEKVVQGVVLTFADVTNLKRAEESNAQLASIVTGSQDAIIGLSFDGAIQSWNLGAERIYGYSAEEAVGRNISFLVPSGLEEDLPHLLEDLRRGRNVESIERPRVTKDGRLIDVSLRFSLMRNLRGNLIGVSKIARDITEKKRMERALERSERELSDFFENAVIGLHWINAEGVIVRANRTELAMLGYAPEEYMGRHISQFLPDRDTAGEFLQRLAKGETVREYETTLRCKDGSARHVVMDASALFEEGRFIHARCFTQDITDRKRAEEALRQSEAEFRLLAESMPQMVWTGRENGDFEYVNQRWCEFTGLSLPETLGTGWTRALHPDDAGPTLATWRTALASGEKPYDVECRIRRAADGSYRWHLGRAIPIRYRDGQVTRWFGTCTDIDDQKRTELALKDAQARLNAHMERLEHEVATRTASLKETVEALEGVTYTIAHDLRAPLRAVQGFSKILLDEYSHGFDEEGKDFAERIASAATRMDTLINDLLAYAKLSHVKLETSPLNLRREVGQSLESLSHVIQAANAKVDADVPPLKIQAHSTLLQHIFSNLITNAIKFVEPGVTPMLSIRAERRGNMVRVLFKDNGIGIARDHHGKIFGLFQRLHTLESYPGTGVGLAIVSKSAERLGGSVGLESEPGKGSLFYLDLKSAGKRK